MAKIIVHVGYPKCLSTTIQRSFFEEHPDINFCGIGVGDNISYKNSDIEFIFEILLKYSRRRFFNMHFERAKDSIEQILDVKRVNVFSNEHLLMNFTLQGVDPHEKLQRIKQLFDGHDVAIIIINRKRENLIKSLYGEMVRMGYYNTFDEFIIWIEKFKDRNFYYDLDFEYVETQVRSLFATTHVLCFEEIVLNVKHNINRELSRILDVRNLSLPIDNDNPSLSSVEIDALRQYNFKHRRELGEGVMTPFEHHRNRTLFSSIGLSLSDSEIYSNVIDKRRAIKSVTGLIP